MRLFISFLGQIRECITSSWTLLDQHLGRFGAIWMMPSLLTFCAFALLLFPIWAVAILRKRRRCRRAGNCPASWQAKRACRVRCQK